MKTTIIFYLIFAGLSAPAFAQQVIGYPTYDNVHREHSFDKQCSHRSTLSLIEDNNTVKTANTLETLTYYSEHLDISTHTIQLYPKAINKGLLFPQHNVQYIKTSNSGLFLFPTPVLKPITSS